MLPRRCTLLVLLLSALAAEASPLEGLAWEPLPLRAPVAPRDVLGAAPWVPPSTPRVEGAVRVGPERGAALWLSPLEVVRVEGEDGALRFERVPRVEEAEAPRLRLEEPGQPVEPGRWLLSEPLGPGSMWVVTATRPTWVRIQRPVASRGPRTEEAVRGALLGWVDGAQPLPPLPFRAELRARLELDAQVAEALVQGTPEDSPLRTAVREWRKASALWAWSLVQPFQASSSRITRPRPPGASVTLEGVEAPFVQPPEGTGMWTLELEGPGVLALEARPLLHATEPGPVTLEVRRQAQALGRLEVVPRPASVGTEADALPPEATVPLQLASGAIVGLSEELRVPLHPGRHTYTVQWTGGPLLLHARVAHRRPFLGEALAKEVHWHHWATRAWKRVEAEGSPQAALLRRRLAALVPELTSAPEVSVPSDGLSAELRTLATLEEAEAATEDGTRAARATAALEAFQGGALDSGSPLAWHLRLRLARLLLDLRQPDTAHRLLSTAPSFPDSGWLAAEAADVVARLPGDERLRSRQLAALELAWRREPLSQEIRRRYRQAWWRAGRWGSLSPLVTEEASAPRPQRWLDLQPVAEGMFPGTDALWPLLPGKSLRVRASGSGLTPTLLRAHVLTPPRLSGPLVLRVGTQAFPLLPLSAVEPVELALPPGEHTLHLEAPEGARAFLSLSPLEGTEAPREVGYVRTQWPVHAEPSAPRFLVPDAQLPSPVRVQLRAPGAQGPVVLRMHTDKGPPRRLVLEPGRADARHLALDGTAALAPPPASLVVTLPPLAREVWFEPENPAVPVFAALAVRRPLDTEQPAAPEVAPASPRALEELLTLSRKLSDTPDAPELLLARAELLHTLREEGLARVDVARLLRHPEALEPARVRRVAALLERLEAGAAEPVRFAQPITQPTLLSPALPALADAASTQARTLATLARESGAREALKQLPEDGGPAERYLRARLLAAVGEEERAALELVRLYQRTGVPQVGLEGLALLERLSPESAPLGSALATRLSTWAEPWLVRRMRETAGGQTRWERLRDVDEKAGTFELLQEAPQDMADLVRKALLAPPWPLEEARLLRAGRTSVLDVVVDAPRRLGAQVRCGAPRAEVPQGPCTFVLRVDGRTLMETQAEPGKQAVLSAELRDPGRHQLELHLREAQAPLLSVVRFVDLPGDTEPRPLSAPRPQAFLRSRPGQPVVLTVLGPTALRVDARALSPRAGRRLLVKSTPMGEATRGEEDPVSFGLPEVPDTTLRGADQAVGAQGEAWLLLPERGAHRVELASPEGEVLVRVRMGVAEPSRPPASPRAQRAPSGPEPLPWPAPPPPLTLRAEPEPVLPPLRGLGTLSAELAYRHEEVDEGELVERPLRTGMELRLGLRQELSPERVWLRLEPELRLPLGSTPVLGSRAALYVAHLPLELRAHVQAALYTQALEDERRWSARGRLAVDRYVRLAPDLGLLPSLGLALEAYPGEAGASAEQFDRNVFWRYGEQHAQRLTPRLALRWQPFQDHVGGLALGATSNADLHTVDHVDGQLRWAALLGGSSPFTRAALGYGLSYRVQDAHRREGYLRHQVSGRLDWSLWTGTEGRLLLFAEDQLLLSSPFGPQNVLAIGARWDWTGGRGLRDALPPEEEFEELLDSRRSPE
jgi:hypothetical protein